MSFQITQIDNGIRVASVSMPGVESVSAGIWAGVGSRNETISVSGISHFLEHMLFKGTRKRSARDIVCAIEGRGGYMNAFTQEESTCYYIRVASDALAESYEVLSDMVARSCFPQEEVEREQGVIVEEIMMYRDQPQHVAHEMLTGAMWHGHPIGMPIAGTPKSVRSIDRKKLVDFYRRHYVPANIVASFAGKLEHDACVSLVRRHLGKMKGRKPRAPVPVRRGVAQQRMALRDASIEQAHMSMGFRIFGRKDRRRYPLRILNAILGENMSSRLFFSVREKYGLAYSIHSSVHLMQDTGVLNISGGFDKRRIKKALEVTARELVRMKTKRVPRSELQRAKDYVTGQIKLGLESTSSRMIWAGEQLLGAGRISDPEKIIERINEVTADEVRDLACYTFNPKKLSVAGVAPDLESIQSKVEGIVAGL